MPESPGVYLFKDKKGEVLYVGKAVNLKNRVRSYFSSLPLGPKTSLLVSRIEKINYFKVESGFDALLLESALIKKYLPDFNSRAKDDKHPLYIRITKEKIPVVSTSRREKEKKAYYFGPYPSGATTRFVLKTLRRIFPYRSSLCHPQNKCFYCHLNLCPGPILEGKALDNYQRVIVQFIKLLSGKRVQLIEEMERQMREMAKNGQFEEAAALRDKILAIQYIVTQRRKPAEYLQNPNLLEDENEKALTALFNILNCKVRTIEAYDVSNLSGKDASGSLVFFRDGEPDKSRYRRFRLKFEGKPNDLKMLTEMLRRRLGHKDWDLPDLILVDGGKTQTGAALDVLREFGVSIPVVGLAKRWEEIIVPQEKSERWQILRLPRESPALKLLQRIRDEAHRFAKSYHLFLRRKIIK